MYNSKIYDLAEPAMFQGSQPGCAPLDELCVGCGEHGTCVGPLAEPHCQCRPGWTGPICDQKTVPSTFDPHSYVQYGLSFEPDHFATSIQLRFRTGKKDGELFRVMDQSAREYGILEVIIRPSFS